MKKQTIMFAAGLVMGCHAKEETDATPETPQTAHAKAASSDQPQVMENEIIEDSVFLVSAG